MLNNNTNNRILIVRLSAIGDIVMATPVADAIKRAQPDSHVVWLAQPECRSLLENNPHVDAVIVWDRQRWSHLWRDQRYGELMREIRRLREALRRHDFTHALDLQGLLKSGFLTWLSGAKQRIGLGSREGSQLMMTRTVPRDQGDTTLIASEYRYLLETLGIAPDPYDLALPIGSADRESARRTLFERIGNEQYAVVCPFTTRPQKHWFDSHWQALIPSLKKEFGVTVLILGGPADKKAADNLARITGAVSLAGHTSLPEAAAVIEGAKLLIGVDTGLTHMGHGYGVPTIALFGSTVPYRHTGLPNSKILYLDLPCAPCKRSPTCGGRFDCMHEITPTMVLTEARRLPELIR